MRDQKKHDIGAEMKRYTDDLRRSSVLSRDFVLEVHSMLDSIARMAYENGVQDGATAKPEASR